MRFPAKRPGTAVAATLGLVSNQGGHMIWVVVVAMATVGFAWMKVRRGRKAGAR
jgi:hypothetical protein